MLNRPNLFILFLFLLLCLNGFSQKRFQSAVFNQIDSISNIVYGEAINIKG
jgi:hypothetical protein